MGGRGQACSWGGGARPAAGGWGQACSWGRGQAYSWGRGQGKFCRQSDLTVAAGTFTRTRWGQSGGLVKLRDTNPSNLSPLLSLLCPRGRGREGMTPWLGAERSLSLSPACRLSTGSPRQSGGAGGAASDRPQQKSKTTFPKHTQPTGPLSVSIQSRRSWCVSNTAC